MQIIEKKVQGTLKNISNEITTTKSRWNYGGISHHM